MSKEIDFEFHHERSSLQFDKETIKELEEAFYKFQYDNSEVMRPRQLKEEFLKHNYDKDQPCIYSMICWICDANEFSGTEYMTFEDFLNYSAFFFSQRHHDEGLKYIFELFDQK